MPEDSKGPLGPQSPVSSLLLLGPKYPPNTEGHLHPSDLPFLHLLPLHKSSWVISSPDRGEQGRTELHTGRKRFAPRVGAFQEPPNQETRETDKSCFWGEKGISRENAGMKKTFPTPGDHPRDRLTSFLVSSTREGVGRKRERSEL